MKIKAKDYAKALVEIQKFNLGNFLCLLQKNGDTKKLREIAILTQKLLLEKSGNKKIVLEIARTLQKKVKIGKKGDVVQEKVIPELIAGIKIIINNEKQLDYSLKNKLEKIFQ